MSFVLPCALLLGSPPFHLHLGRDYTGPPRTDVHDDDQSDAKFYHEQTLNHFTDNQDRVQRLWSQRYYEDKTLWGGNGFPIFLSLGGEGPAYGAPGGLQRELALQHQAALITLEHRFYGESRPTDDMSSEALRHLSAEEALADAARFIQWWSESHTTLNSTWIAFGGSYSGQLASWLRLRYPRSVGGAVAYSAPILSQLDFYSYNQVVTDVVADFGGADCVSLVTTSLTALAAAFSNGTAPVRRDAAKALHACSITTAEAGDGMLVGSVQGAIQSLVQYNQHGGKRSVSSFCDAGKAAAQNGSAPIDVLAAMLAAVRPASACLASNDTAYMEQLTDTNFTTGTPTNRQFYYQLCNEFGQQTCEPYSDGCATGVPQLRPSLFAPLSHKDDLAGGLQLCKQLYGITATPPAHWSGKQRGWTNVVHGGRAFAGSNVIFINGRRDPYSSVSLLPEELQGAQARLGVRSVAVRDGSHCVGMGVSDPHDAPDVAAVKKAVTQAVGEWLQ